MLSERSEWTITVKVKQAHTAKSMSWKMLRQLADTGYYICNIGERKYLFSMMLSVWEKWDLDFLQMNLPYGRIRFASNNYNSKNSLTHKLISNDKPTITKEIFCRQSVWKLCPQDFCSKCISTAWFCYIDSSKYLGVTLQTSANKYLTLSSL